MRVKFSSPREFNYYSSFELLTHFEDKGDSFNVEHFEISGSRFLIAAPHAADIERGTGTLAVSIAGQLFSRYLFLGGHPRCHISSLSFDEPTFVRLCRTHETIVCIHGCRERSEEVMLGGRDKSLLDAVGDALLHQGLLARKSGHRFPALESENICNKGIARAGLQLEVSLGLRNNPDGVEVLARTVQQALLSISPPAKPLA